jgi:hypothetical protein
VDFSVSDSEDNTDYVESKDESPSELDSEEDSSEGNDVWTQEEVEEVVAKLMEHDKPDLNWSIMEAKSKMQWKKAETTRKLGYTGTSQRTRQRNAKSARVGAKICEEAQKK